jgi:hypothetical protein
MSIPNDCKRHGAFRTSVPAERSLGLKRIIQGSWELRVRVPGRGAGVKGGFGYLWWCAIDGCLFPTVNLKGADAAWGAGGRSILVIPQIDTVIVHRFNTDIDEGATGVTDEQFGTLKCLVFLASR